MHVLSVCIPCTGSCQTSESTWSLLCQKSSPLMVVCMTLRTSMDIFWFSGVITPSSMGLQALPVFSLKHKSELLAALLAGVFGL